MYARHAHFVKHLAHNNLGLISSNYIRNLVYIVLAYIINTIINIPCKPEIRLVTGVLHLDILQPTSLALFGLSYSWYYCGILQPTSLALFGLSYSWYYCGILQSTSLTLFGLSYAVAFSAINILHGLDLHVTNVLWHLAVNIFHTVWLVLLYCLVTSKHCCSQFDVLQVSLQLRAAP